MTTSFIEHKALLEELVKMTREANQRLIKQDDSFFVEYSNFFIKSFLVTMCAYLESYIKDSVMLVIEDANERLKIAKLPYNFIKWAVSKTPKDSLLPLTELKFIEKEDNEQMFQTLSIHLKKRDIDKHISANPYKLIDLYKNIGINLRNFETFETQTELIQEIVNKRNQVVHDNDKASDISFLDIENFILNISQYLHTLDTIIYKYLHR